MTAHNSGLVFDARVALSLGGVALLPLRVAMRAIDPLVAALPYRAAPRLSDDDVLVEVERLALKIVTANQRQVAVPGLDDGRRTPSKDLSVLVAGSGHFHSLWARDMAFASHGLLRYDEYWTTVRGSLHAILSNQREDGLLPRRVGGWMNRTLAFASALGVHLPDDLDFNYVDYVDGEGRVPVDTNALMIVLAAEYGRRSGDVDFLYVMLPRLAHALTWLGTQCDEGGLVRQEPSADWKDMVRRGGVVTYTNVLYYQAAVSLAEIARSVGDDAAAEARTNHAAHLRERIQKRLWDDARGVYRDAEGLDDLSPDGNLLALIFGVATDAQADRIFTALENLRRASPLPLPAADRPYPETMVSGELRAAGIPRYHDLMIWPWQGCVYAAAAARHGRTALAWEVLVAVARQALQDGTFYEIYAPQPVPRPVRTWLYGAERDFTWSAGTFLWALQELRGTGAGAK